MRHIQKLVEHIEDELESAKDYAESYIEHKAKGDSSTASRFKTMAEDELSHAMFFHEMAVKEIDTVSKLYAPPAEMLEKWEHEHREYVDRVSRIKQILSL